MDRLLQNDLLQNGLLQTVVRRGIPKEKAMVFHALSLLASKHLLKGPLENPKPWEHFFDVTTVSAVVDYGTNHDIATYSSTLLDLLEGKILIPSSVVVRELADLLFGSKVLVKFEGSAIDAVAQRYLDSMVRLAKQGLFREEVENSCERVLNPGVIAMSLEGQELAPIVYCLGLAVRLRDQGLINSRILRNIEPLADVKVMRTVVSGNKRSRTR